MADTAPLSSDVPDTSPSAIAAAVRLPVASAVPETSPLADAFAVRLPVTELVPLTSPSRLASPAVRPVSTLVADTPPAAAAEADSVPSSDASGGDTLRKYGVARNDLDTCRCPGQAADIAQRSAAWNVLVDSEAVAVIERVEIRNAGQATPADRQGPTGGSRIMPIWTDASRRIWPSTGHVIFATSSNAASSQAASGFGSGIINVS
jgi:hypothetical protein